MSDPLNYVTKLSPELLRKVHELWQEDDRLRAQFVRLVRDWLKQQPHLHCRTDAHFILCYARGCKYSLEKIKRKLDLTLTMRTALPEFFSGWDPKRPELQAALKLGASLPLPGYDALGRKVIVSRPCCFDPYVIKPEDVEKVNYMVGEIMNEEDEQFFVNGMVGVIDMAGFNLGHLTQRPMTMIKKQTQYFQEAMPWSPKCMLFINTASSFSAAFSVLQATLNDKMKGRLQVLGSSKDDMEVLYKTVPKAMLPKDYGGEGASMAELAAEWKTKVEGRRQWLMEQEKYRADESKRPGKPKTSRELFGIEGSFRQLSVD